VDWRKHLGRCQVDPPAPVLELLLPAVLIEDGAEAMFTAISNPELDGDLYPSDANRYRFMLCRQRQKRITHGCRAVIFLGTDVMKGPALKSPMLTTGRSFLSAIQGSGRVRLARRQLSAAVGDRVRTAPYRSIGVELCAWRL